MKIVSLVLSGRIVSNAETVAESSAEVAKAVENSESIARALVVELRKQGVKIEVASVAFAPRPGDHGPTQTVDLLAPVPVPVEAAAVEAPAEVPVGGVVSSESAEGVAPVVGGVVAPVEA